MKIFIICLIMVFVFIGCGAKDPSKGPGRVTEDGKKVGSSQSGKIEKKKRVEKEEEYEEVKPGKGDDFFRGGYKTVKGEKAGVYIVVKGDSIWKISGKYCQYYKRMDNYSLTNHGNAAYCINKFNYDHLFCGVNDEIDINQKVYVPVDFIDRVERLSRKSSKKKLSFIRQICNSYGPWVKIWSQETRGEMAIQYIDKAIEVGDIIEIDNKYILNIHEK